MTWHYHATGLALLTLGKALDTHSTVVGLARGAHEANPVARAVYEASGPSGLWLYAIALLLGLTLVVELSRWAVSFDGRTWPQYAVLSAYPLLGVFWIAVAGYNYMLVAGMG